MQNNKRADCPPATCLPQPTLNPEAQAAFESGVAFNAEVVTDQSRFLSEVADDFWRVHFYTDDTTMAALLRERLKPAQLVDLLVQLTNNPTLRVTPPPEDRAILEQK